MKKNNISIINEIIMILQNHIEYNTTEFITTHCINNDGSIDYDIKFTLEDSDKEEKEQTNIVKFGDVPEEVIPTADDFPCACEPINEVEEKTAPISKKSKKDRKRCGNCKYYDEVKKNSCTLYDKEVSSWTMLDISNCFESI